MLTEQISRLLEKNILTPIDTHFAEFVSALSGSDKEEFILAAALLSRRTRQGHVCLDLGLTGGKEIMTDYDEPSGVVCPAAEKLAEALKENSATGFPGEVKPLILDHNNRLYLYRYWEYQQKTADFIIQRAHDNIAVQDTGLLNEKLDMYFPEVKTNSKEQEETGVTNWQRIGALTALTKKFCVISGGPGTGKTTTVTRILSLLIEQSYPAKLRIALAAPTGKAAARLQNSIKSAKSSLPCEPHKKELIPETASTIHRLLGSVYGSPYFRHDEKNPLETDVLIVDEASMVPISLMAKLMQALRPSARLILLGDKDQLSSVEAGAVLGDICDCSDYKSYPEGFLKLINECGRLGQNDNFISSDGDTISDCIVQLKKSYRFKNDSGIGLLSRKVNEGNAAEALSILKEGSSEEVAWKELKRAETIPELIREKITLWFESYINADNPAEAFKRFESFRILCALREGPFGVNEINRIAEQVLKEKKLIWSQNKWYHGRPVIITGNDYNLQLFNGDTGLVLPDKEAQNNYRAFFVSPDGSFRRFHQLRLPVHETVYAMTVHKSQGSEFDNVLLILPDRDAPVLTRELLYTGITRARKSVEIWGTSKIFTESVLRKTERNSGLKAAILESISSEAAV